MFALFGLLLGFAFFFGCCWLVDYIGYRRGLGGAHPLSPAMAWAATFGALGMLALLILGMRLDVVAIASLPTQESEDGR